MSSPFQNYLSSMGLTLQDLSPSAYSDLSGQFNLYGPTQSGVRGEPTTSSTLTDAIPISQQLGITLNNLPQDSPMRTDNRIVSEEYGLEPLDYGESELMESDTTTRDGIFEGLKNKLDPRNALGFLANVYTSGGMKQALTTSGLGKLFSNILEAGGNTPNYQFINPNKSGFNRIASDFYDPRTGLDRFDRAKTLFGQSRTMKDFLDALKEQRDRRAANRAAVQRAIQNQQDAGGSVQSSDGYSGVGDQGATGANFSGDFATDSASYDL